MNETTRLAASYKPIALHYGLIGGAILVIIGLISYLLGLSDPLKQEGAVKWINNLITIAVIGWAVFTAMKTYRDQELNGHMSYGRGLAVGSFVSLILAVITIVWSLLFFIAIAPETVNQVREMAIIKMEQQGLSDSQIEQQAKMMDIFTSPTAMAIIAGVSTFALSFVVSLILAGIAKKDQIETQ